MKPETSLPEDQTRQDSSEDLARPDGGRFAYEGLDRIIHERARLSVLTSLLTHPKGLTFNELKQLCSLTDGNLSRHLSILEKGDLIEILKGHDRNRPLTVCKVTATGRKRYLEYLNTLEQVVRDAEKSTRKDKSPRTTGDFSPKSA